MLEQDKSKELDRIEKEVTNSDETMHLFVYGNLKIIDKETGEILVNKGI